MATVKKSDRNFWILLVRFPSSLPAIVVALTEADQLVWVTPDIFKPGQPLFLDSDRYREVSQVKEQKLLIVIFTPKKHRTESLSSLILWLEMYWLINMDLCWLVHTQECYAVLGFDLGHSPGGHVDRCYAQGISFQWWTCLVRWSVTRHLQRFLHQSSVYSFRKAFWGNLLWTL